MVYVSMGTVNNDMLPLYRQFVAVFAKTNHQVIMSEGNQVSMEQSGDLPDNISVYESVDQIAVLEQADGFKRCPGVTDAADKIESVCVD